MSTPSEFLAEKYLRPDQAAKLLGISKRTLERRVAAGYIGYFQERKGCARYFLRSELERYRDQFYVPPVTVGIRQPRAYRVRVKVKEPQA